MKIFRLVACAATVSAELNCFDGNNGGCSHLCTSAGCECPECWELDDFDSFNCKIQAGMATVTCSATGTEIFLNKCVAPDVGSDQIHLVDPACHAVESPLDFDEDRWYIGTPSATSCGALPFATEDVLHYDNYLIIGGKTVNGIVLGRPSESFFTCSFNTTTTVTSAYSSSNTPVHTSFNLGDVVDDSIVIDYNIQFASHPDLLDNFEGEYEEFSVGNPIFAKISFSEQITDFGMKVKSCVIFDSANEDLKVDLIEDFCPNDLGLEFAWGPQTGMEVGFRYTSFAFPDSSADATMIVECDVELCNDEVCEQGCPLIPTSDSDSEMDVLGS